MANRRRRQLPLPEHNESHAPNNMEQLAFKYMDLCKVESSTDSDSEISPRWSDTSTMGCVSSAPESGSLGQTLSLVHKPAGRHGSYSLSLDPYDGSSEDSEESNVDVGVSSRRTRQQGKGACRFSGRSRRFTPHHPPSIVFKEVVTNGTRDVQMKCGSGSELWVCELDSLPSHSDRDACKDLTEEMTNDLTRHTQNMEIGLHLDDSGIHATRSSTPQTPGCLIPAERQMLDSSSERSPSPCNLRILYKRKLGLPGTDMVELMHRKRRCVVNMEDEPEGGNSASEAS